MRANTAAFEHIQRVGAGYELTIVSSPPDRRSLAQSLHEQMLLRFSRGLLVVSEPLDDCRA